MTAGDSIAPTTDSPRLRQHEGVARVRTVLQEQSAQGPLVDLGQPARTAAEAAAALDVEVGQIASSLLFEAEHDDGSRRPLLVLTPGGHRVDEIQLTGLLDLASLSRVDAETVRAITGFAIGGVAPVGLLRPVDTVVDVSLGRYDHVWTSGGHPCVVLRTTYDELLRITAGQAAEVG